jgi:hypothetical protein
VTARLLAAIERPESEAEIVVKIRNLAVERDSASDQRARLLVAPGRVSERAGKVQRMHVLRLGGKHFRELA